MFDIGFSELMVIGVVALIVIGPEKLPKVARTVGAMIGRMQRYVNDVKADINREIELDELRKFKNEFESAANTVESTIRGEVAKVESAANEAARDAQGLVDGTSATPAAAPADPSVPAPPPAPKQAA